MWCLAGYENYKDNIKTEKDKYDVWRVMKNVLGEWNMKYEKHKDNFKQIKITMMFGGLWKMFWVSGLQWLLWQHCAAERLPIESRLADGCCIQPEIISKTKKNVCSDRVIQPGNNIKKRTSAQTGCCIQPEIM